MARTAITYGIGTLILGWVVLAGAPALAGDVAVTLDAGTRFSIKGSTGTERVGVQEATGNITRNGALFVHTTGTSNIFVGILVGNTSTTGIGGNAGFGSAAMQLNTTGYFNSAFGTSALASNSTGHSNSAVGHSALLFNSTGNSNSAVGYAALRANTSGSRNSAFGLHALRSNTTGAFNSAIGSYVLRGNTTGFRNSALGYSALRDNTTAAGNSAVGAFALRSNTTGGNNSAVGYQSMITNDTGSLNSAFGLGALRSNTSGSSNTAAGVNSLSYNTAGFRNVAVGQNAGRSQTIGSDNIYLANTGVAAENTTIRIGCPTGLCPSTAPPHSRAFVAGIRGATTGVADAIPVLIDSAGQLGTVSSSRSVKKDIRDMGDATDRLLDLRPVMFRYKQQQTLTGGGEVPPEYGLIAEEVAEVLPELVVYDENGKPFTVKYHEMAPMLLNEMKKQQHTIEGQQHRIEGQQQTIEGQQHVIVELSSRLAIIEGKIESAAAPEERIR